MFVIKKVNGKSGVSETKIPWIHYGHLVMMAVMANNQEIALDLLRSYNCSMIPFHKREKLARSFPSKELGDIMAIELLSI